MLPLPTDDGCKHKPLPLEPDLGVEYASDGKIVKVVERKPIVFPPVRSFDVDNLLASGIPLNPVASEQFISPSVDDTLDKVDEISTLIDNNELHEF